MIRKRNPFVSPELCQSMPLRPHARFMQQRYLYVSLVKFTYY
ncbi:MAG: hypothetical protein V3Q69_04455 [Burkholderia sp.]